MGFGSREELDVERRSHDGRDGVASQLVVLSPDMVDGLRLLALKGAHLDYLAESARTGVGEGEGPRGEAL